MPAAVVAAAVVEGELALRCRSCPRALPLLLLLLPLLLLLLLLMLLSMLLLLMLTPCCGLLTPGRSPRACRRRGR